MPDCLSRFRTNGDQHDSGDSNDFLIDIQSVESDKWYFSLQANPDFYEQFVLENNYLLNIYLPSHL